MDNDADPAPVSGYGSVVEKSTAGIFELQDDEFSYINKQFADVFGYARNELIGTSPFSLLDDSEYHAFKEDMETLAQGDADSVKREYSGTRQNGDEVVVQAHLTFTDKASDSVYVGFVEDVTNQESHERERETIIDRVTDGVVEVDENWDFTLVDDRAADIYNKTEAELRGTSFWDEFPEALGTRFEEVYREVMNTREAACIEEYNIDLDGWFHVEVYPTQTEGLAFYFQDISDQKRHQVRMSGLKEILSECLDAESKQEVCNVITETADVRLHLPIIAIALTNERVELRPVARSKEAQARLDTTHLLDSDNGVAWEVFMTGESMKIADPSSYLPSNTSIGELIVHPLGSHGVLVTGTSSPDADFIQTLAEDIRLIFDALDREESLRNRDKLLEEQNESLNRLNRINTVIRSIDQELVHASTRAEIEQAVCEHLTEGDTYTFAWIGEYESTLDQINPVEADGYQQGYLGPLLFSIDEQEQNPKPTEEAVMSRETVVVDDLLSKNPPHQPWREAALTRGYRSVIAIPLMYEGSIYGTLTIYSGQPGLFDDSERRVLSELGETVAHAINAIESKQALVSDTVVELELRVNLPDHPLVELVEEGGDDRAFEFESIVPTDAGNYRIFYHVHGMPPDEFLEFVDRTIIMRNSQLVAEYDACLFESVLTEESLLFWLLDRGAIPQSFVVDQSGGQLRVELSGDIDIRSFVEHFKAAYPESELVASRKCERKTRTRRGLKTDIEERLTDRQREILQIAYFSGYFNTPRDRTGEEIADSIGVSAPTVSDHIRAGLRNLFDFIYEDDESPE